MFHHTRERKQWIPTIGPFRTMIGIIREMPVESSSEFSRAVLPRVSGGNQPLRTGKLHLVARVSF